MARVLNDEGAGARVSERGNDVCFMRLADECMCTQGQVKGEASKWIGGDAVFTKSKMLTTSTALLMAASLSCEFMLACVLAKLAKDGVSE